MKVRIGVGVGAVPADPEVLAALGSDIVELGLDSVWLPELLTAPTLDPVVALSWLAGAHPSLKVGTTMLLPGRHLLRLAKQVATLDAVSGGRFLVTLVPGVVQGAERNAVGPPPGERGSIIEEAMPLLRRLWAGEPVTYRGSLGQFDEVKLFPLPVQDPFDVWAGGLVEPSLRRCGRLFDGWLPAFCTPDEARRGRRVVEESAAEAERSISPEHYGVSIGYAREALESSTVEALRPRLRGQPVEEVVPAGFTALRALVERFLEAGFSKFVLRPFRPATSWREELEDLAAAVGDLQT